jgi:hypothetical protein
MHLTELYDSWKIGTQPVALDDLRIWSKSAPGQPVNRLTFGAFDCWRKERVKEKGWLAAMQSTPLPIIYTGRPSHVQYCTVISPYN